MIVKLRDVENTAFTNLVLFLSGRDDEPRHDVDGQENNLCVLYRDGTYGVVLPEDTEVPEEMELFMKLDTKPGVEPKRMEDESFFILMDCLAMIVSAKPTYNNLGSSLTWEVVIEIADTGRVVMASYQWDQEDMSAVKKEWINIPLKTSPILGIINDLAKGIKKVQ
ncbi:MAG: hypothetical protein EXS47_02265 [Candidatus Zambryskibacteria bacterium]|nr:hypothetical protein [Candidatus Zambryskibacteria bacterium]